MEEKDRIQFKPLHEGMGFHPFKDGLPYAPESKSSNLSSRSKGAGAVAAGRPQFATARQLKQIQEQHQITPALVIPTASPSTRAKEIRGAEPHSQPQAAQPQAAQTQAPLTQSSSLLRRRVFAYLMDTVIHAGFWVATNLAALFLFDFQIDLAVIREHLFQFGLFFAVSQWLFISLQELLFETTIGKAFFNLEFKRNHHSLFLRSIVFMIGALALGLGLYFRIHDKLGQLQLRQKIYS